MLPRLLRPRRRAPAAWIVAALAVAVAPAARGATYTITTLAEDTDANGNCTLREALIAAANDGTQDLCVGDVGADTIVLAAVGTYSLQAGEIIDGFRAITVRGDPAHPASSYVVDLGGAQRFLWLDFDAALTLENLTLANGLGTTHGGAILANNSDLTLRDVTITGSHAENGGGVTFVTFAGHDHHLDVESARFEANGATGDQAYGGGLEVGLQGAGSARIVRASFLDNRIDAASGGFSRKGGGLSLESFSGGTIELRHLDVEGNVIDAPSFAQGAGIELFVSSTAAFLLEDVLIAGNEIAVADGTNGPSGLDLDLEGPPATVRRLRLTGNLGTAGRDQAVIQAGGATSATISDLLVVDGDAAGLFLATSGDSCSLVAGNLTVAGHPETGLQLEAACPLRVENSIVFGNATSSGTDLQVFSGTPDVSAENLVGVDPGFVDAAGGDYRLGGASVAADAGDATFASVGPFDAVHGPRILGATLDLGALERDGLFADDFERNDLLAWSAAAGGP